MEASDPIVRRLQITRFWMMSPEQKLELAGEMRELAWELCAADLRSRFPELSQEEVSGRVRRRFRDDLP